MRWGRSWPRSTAAPPLTDFLQLGAPTIAFLLVAAFVAGWVDAVVGGGGLIQLPALLIGLPPAGKEARHVLVDAPESVVHP